MNRLRVLGLLGCAFGLVALAFSADPASPAGWEFVSGRWSTTGARIRQLDSSSVGVALEKGTRQRYSAQVKVRFPSGEKGAAAGLVLQALDPSNYCMLVLERKKASVYAVLKTYRAGKKLTYVSEEVVGDQAPVQVDPAQWQQLRAEVEGPHIAGYLNGTEVVTFSFLGTAPKWYAHGPLWDTDPESGRAGLYTKDTTAEFMDFQVGQRGARLIYTPNRPRLDYRGRVLAKRSYAQTFSQWTRWVADSVRYLEYRDAPEKVRTLPFYLLSSFVFSDDSLGTDIQYPGHNHPPIIEGFVKQYLFSGDTSYLKLARELADWNIRHSTPADWALAHLTLSHFDFRKHLDSLEAVADSGFEPDKSAYQGLAYLLLYSATEDKKYLDAAVRMAETLRPLQREDGGFPFRVRPRDGKVLAPYTASLLWYVRFFEDLADFTGNEEYRQVRDRAFRWLMENPVRTNEWQGFYGDIATGAESYDQWTALDTAMYLLERRGEDPSYLPTALEIVKWVEGKLVVQDGFYPGVPAILEQTSYPVILSIHTNRLAEVYARLWGALGDLKYKELAQQISNTITWLLMSDGKMRAGLWFHAPGTATSVIIFNGQFLRIMAEIPETAPQNENHFLHHSGYVRKVSYSPQRIRLQTWSPGEARFSLKQAPAAIRDETGPIPEVRELGEKKAGWLYDPQNHLLRLRYPGKSLVIDLAEEKQRILAGNAERFLKGELP